MEAVCAWVERVKYRLYLLTVGEMEREYGAPVISHEPLTTAKHIYMPRPIPASADLARNKGNEVGAGLAQSIRRNGVKGKFVGK